MKSFDAPRTDNAQQVPGTKLGARIVLAVGCLLMLAIVLFAGILLRRIESDGQAAIDQYRISEIDRLKNNLREQVDMAYRILVDMYGKSTQTEFIVHTYGDQLRSVVDIAENLVRRKIAEVKEGTLSLSQARRQAMDSLRALRFDGDLGYVWINDETRPYPSLLMHPTLPELDGVSMSVPLFEKALGSEKNIGKAILDVCEKNGEGFVEYLWPKPTKDGLTPDMPKLSYVRRIEEWGWIIGAGVYVDEARKNVIGQAIEIIGNMRHAGGEGYFWINDTGRPYPRMIVHPQLAGATMEDPLFNIALQGDKSLSALILDISEQHGEGFVEYLWPKPTREGATAEALPKISYVRLFEPLNWILGTGVYLDEIENTIASRKIESEKQLASIFRSIVLVAIVLFLIAFALLFLVVRGIVSPIVQLTGAADRIASGDMNTQLPDAGPREIRSLSRSFNRMTEELKERMAALRESEERFRRLAENSPDLIFRISLRDGRYEYISPAVLRMLGYSQQEAYGTPLFARTIIHPDFTAFFRREWENLRHGTMPSTFEFKVLTKSGEERWMHQRNVLIRGENGEPTAMEGIVTDITDRKTAEAALDSYREHLEELVRERTSELEVAKEAAEHANRAKSAFLANMSHEIRTPLNAVLGFASILERDENLSEAQAEQVRTINRSGHHLLKLINDILDMSRIESGQLELNTAPFCLHDLLSDMETMFRSRANAKGLHLLIERQESVPRYAAGDEAKLRQILVNLLGNAVKFTKAGGVAIRARADADEETPDSVRLFVEIEDTGPGIPPEDIDHVFDAFQQSQAGHDAGGTGLGLSISRRLAELMGGSLTLKSRVGTGSSFTLSLPVRTVQGVERPKSKTERSIAGLKTGGKTFRILIVDDVKENRDVLRAMLSPARTGRGAPPSFELREAENGEETLTIVDEWAPHIVLMDMRMPVMDGYEATRRIKGNDKTSGIPVIAVTASAFEDDRDSVLKAGVDRYIRKPFRAEELFETLGSVLALPFIYHEDATTAASDDIKSASPAPEKMEKLPGDLQEAMREAVENGDMAALDELLERAKTHDAAAAEHLRALAKRYDYESLVRILR